MKNPKKITILILVTLLLSLIFNLSVFSENKSIKIIGPLGLTRAFKNNINKTMTAKVEVKNGNNEVNLQNIRNGKVANKSIKNLKNGNTLVIFDSIEKGNWNLIIKDVDKLVSVKLN